jgi:zinc protease
MGETRDAAPSGASAPIPGRPAITTMEVDGLRVLLRFNPGQPVVAARFYVRGGAANAGPDYAGIEALLGRTARRGTKNYPKALLNATLAQLGADLGSAAGFDFSVYTLRCLRRDWRAAAKVFAEVIARPSLEASEVELVRQQMLLEHRQMLDSPDGALGERAQMHCYAGHPYAALPYGTERSLQVLAAATLPAHAARHLTRANALLVLVGDLDAEAAVEMAHEFTALPAGTGAAPPPPALGFARGTLVVEPRALPTNYVRGEFTAPALGDADYPAALLGMSVLRDRFFEEVRTKRNLSYAPAASLADNWANLGSIYVSAVDPTAALQVMRTEMRRLAEEPLPAKDLADKVCTFLTRYYLRNETTQAQAGFLASYELHGGGWERATEFVPRLEAVRPAEVQRFAARCFRHIQYVYLGDPERADPAVYVDP